MAAKHEQGEIVRLSITLKFVEPRIARRLDVPLRVELDLLHDYIQAAMGWMNCHLWGFEARRFGERAHWSDDDWSTGAGNTLLDIIDFLDGRVEFTYFYDFGDSWTHRIRVGKIQQARHDRRYPYLVSATGRCPPEDIGGAWGYAEFLRALDDPDSAEYDEYVPEYADGTWDAQDAGLDERRAALARFNT